MGSYYWCLLSFLVGILAGFQGIHNRYPLESLRLLPRWPALAYLATRGLVPAVVYCGALSQGRLPTAAPLFALTLGVGLELILRIKFFVSEREQPDGSLKEILIGPFGLLRWYQEWFLARMGDDVVTIRMQAVRSLIEEGTPFESLCDRVGDRLDLIANESMKKQVRKLLDQRRKESKDDPLPRSSELDARRKFRLALTLLKVVGQPILKQLMSH